MISEELRKYYVEWLDPNTNALKTTTISAADKTAARDIFFVQNENVSLIEKITLVKYVA
jgi:hypothetical protein